MNSDGKAPMTTPAPQLDLAWHLRRLLEAARESCGQNGRWKWLARPMTLLMALWTRRERREAADAMAAVQGVLEGFIGLLEDFRAGRLVAEAEGGEAEERANGTDRAVAYPPPQPSPTRQGYRIWRSRLRR